MKKIAIIGRGTAGCLALTHFTRWAENDFNIDLYYDPSIPQQSVGEGSPINLPASLHTNINFNHSDLKYVDGSFKAGIVKTGWGTGVDFTHHFAPPSVGYHFNAVKLQDYILEHFRNNSRVRIIQENVGHDVDADFVFDCSGKPDSYDEYNMSEAIPVNSTYITQCYWDYPRFQHTLTLARPHGWVFGIPLQNRCSIGYMYNSNTSSLEDVKADVQNVFDEYNLIPSNTTNAFSFKNYSRKQNFTERIAYSGNASFFLEPLEATSIALMEQLQRNAFGLWWKAYDVNHANTKYSNQVNELENMMALHYYAGSIFKTPFWDMAQEKGTKKIEQAMVDPRFRQVILDSKNYKFGDNGNYADYGSWWPGSFKVNLENLGLYNKLEKFGV